MYLYIYVCKEDTVRCIGMMTYMGGCSNRKSLLNRVSQITLMLGVVSLMRPYKADLVLSMKVCQRS